MGGATGGVLPRRVQPLPDEMERMKGQHRAEATALILRAVLLRIVVDIAKTCQQAIGLEPPSARSRGQARAAIFFRDVREILPINLCGGRV